MTKTLHARFDGEALHPEEPLPLTPDSRVVITVEIGDAPERERPAMGAPYSFLAYAQSLQLEGPEDWSEKVDYYLYGNDRSDEP